MAKKNRDFLKDLENIKPVELKFNFRNRVLKEGELEEFLKHIDEKARDAKQVKRVLTIIEQALEALGKGLFIPIL